MRGNEGKCWIKGMEEGKRPLKKGGDKQQEKNAVTNLTRQRCCA